MPQTLDLSGWPIFLSLLKSKYRYVVFCMSDHEIDIIALGFMEVLIQNRHSHRFGTTCGVVYNESIAYNFDTLTTYTRIVRRFGKLPCS
jgi:hypothetical protein